MYKLSAALALLALAQASLAAISPTNPIAGTVWKQGSKATIAWTATGTDATGTVDINLVHGDATALQPVTDIVSGVKGSTGKYTWAVPADLPDGADYAVAFGTAPNIYYSHYFTIGKAAAVSSGASSAPAAASTSAPLSTAQPSIFTSVAPSHSASGSMNASAAAPTVSATSAGAHSAAALALPAVAAIAAVAAFM